MSTFTQMIVAVVFLPGIASIGPALQGRYGLTLVQTGLIFTGVQLGPLTTVALWGLATDRWGDRLTLVVGLVPAAVILLLVSRSHSFFILVVGLTLGSMFATATAVASVRAAVLWFGAHQRGLALGIRQMSFPLGGAAGALLLPRLSNEFGVPATLAWMGVICAVAALIAVVGIRKPPTTRAAPVAKTRLVIRDPNVRRLTLCSSLLVFGQTSLTAYLVIFLTSHRHLPLEVAALVFLVSQVGAAGARVGGGLYSDFMRSRVRPMRQMAVAVLVLLGATILTSDLPLPLLLPPLVLATVFSMSANGIAAAAITEMTNMDKVGESMGFQLTMHSLSGVIAPVAFGATVAYAGWSAGFALVGVLALAAWVGMRPLVALEAGRQSRAVAAVGT
ncbi:MAG: hypothetical protein QOK05_646 [Chloroflexota bacterium]|nr:hypothetical protein [Chloroflexota bacterium]